MKTLNIILLTVLAALVIYSCSADRDQDEVQIQPASAKFDLKPLKKENNQGNAARPGDSTTVQPQIALPPTEPLDPYPSEGGDPKDVPVPPRR